MDESKILIAGDTGYATPGIMEVLEDKHKCQPVVDALDHSPTPTLEIPSTITRQQQRAMQRKAEKAKRKGQQKRQEVKRALKRPATKGELAALHTNVALLRDEANDYRTAVLCDIMGMAIAVTNLTDLLVEKGTITAEEKETLIQKSGKQFAEWQIKMGISSDVTPSVAFPDELTNKQEADPDAA